jgi:hypothetical protein
MNNNKIKTPYVEDARYFLLKKKYSQLKKNIHN